MSSAAAGMGPRPQIAPSRASRPASPPRALLARLKAAARDYSRPDLALAIVYLETPGQTPRGASDAYEWAVDELSTLLAEQVNQPLGSDETSEERADRAARVRELAELLALTARGLETAERQRAA